MGNSWHFRRTSTPFLALSCLISSEIRPFVDLFDNNVIVICRQGPIVFGRPGDGSKLQSTRKWIINVVHSCTPLATNAPDFYHSTPRATSLTVRHRTASLTPSLTSTRGISDSQDASKTMMVEKGCDRCREWQEHYYWTHMDVSKISFFKLMTGDFARGINLPEKFARNFKVTEVVDLKVTSGETWHIGLEKHGNDLYLGSGWADFVKAQELEENDLLIFTCSGHSSFDVQIFEESGCIKVSSLFGPGMCSHLNDMAGRYTEHYSLSSHSDDFRTPSPVAGFPHNTSTSKKSSGREPDSPNSRSCYDKHEVTEEEESDGIYADSKYYYSRVANRLTDDEKDEILGLAPIGRDNPVFVTVLLKNHCQRHNNNLNIPSGFADHLEAQSHDIILRRPNRKEKWSLRYYHTPYYRCFRSSRFFNFMRENKLREGDICVFELMKGVRKVMMTIHVIRKKVDGRLVLVD